MYSEYSPSYPLRLIRERLEIEIACYGEGLQIIGGERGGGHGFFFLPPRPSMFVYLPVGLRVEKLSSTLYFWYEILLLDTFRTLLIFFHCPAYFRRAGLLLSVVCCGALQ